MTAEPIADIIPIGTTRGRVDDDDAGPRIPDGLDERQNGHRATAFDADSVAREYGEEPPADAPSAHPARELHRLEDLAHFPSAAEDGVLGGGLITRGGKLLLTASAGAGKTTFVDHLAGALASGRPFLGKFRVDRPYRVLDISAEMTRPEAASHALALLSLFESTPAVTNLVFWLETGLRLPRCYAELREVTHQVGAEIVIFDPFMEFFEGESSDKPEHVQKVFAAVDQLQREENLAGTVIVHHMGVAGVRSAGSWKFDGWPSTILELQKVPGVPTDRMLAFKKIRAPGFGHHADLQIRLSDAGYLPVAYEEPTSSVGELVVVQALREAGGQLRRQELIDHVKNRANVRVRAAVGYIGKAKQSGLIDVFPDGREVIYRVTPGQGEGAS
jgi:AAA domain